MPERVLKMFPLESRGNVDVRDLTALGVSVDTRIHSHLALPVTVCSCQEECCTHGWPNLLQVKENKVTKKYTHVFLNNSETIYRNELKMLFGF